MDGSTQKFNRLLDIQCYLPGPCGAWEPLLDSAGSSHRPFAVIADQCQPLSLGVQGKDELLSIEISCVFTELLSFLEGIY